MSTSKSNEDWREEIIDKIKDWLISYCYNNGEFNPRNLENLIKITDNELNTLKIIHFLLSEEMKNFLNVIPSLLRNLSHSTNNESEVQYGKVKGYINWNKTIKARLSKGNNPSLFVCNNPNKHYNLEENQLLKFILTEILNLIRNLDLDIDKNTSSLKVTDGWYSEIENINLRVKNYLKNIKLANIPVNEKITSKYLRKTQNNRNKKYIYLYKVYMLYFKLFKDFDWGIFKNLVEKQILEPLEDDKLFELFVFFSILDQLGDSYNNSPLLKNGMIPVCYDMDKNTYIYVHYQNSKVFNPDLSNYKNIFQNYDINVSMRIPDIVLEFNKNGEKHLRIIEVKKTQDKQYIVDSIYKVLGYLQDFNKEKYADNPKAIIVVWDGINITDMKKAYNQDVLILNHKEFLNELGNILNI